MTDAREHVDRCLNCGEPTPGAYCAACGQEAVRAGVSFRHQLEHFFEEVFTVEARLPRTLWLLAAKPGELTRAYNAGQRVRYVTPLKLYLLASVAFFFALSFSASREPAHIVLDGSTAQIVFGSAPPPGRAWATPEQIDAWLATQYTTPSFTRARMQSLLVSPKGVIGATVDMLARASIALVPIYALVLKLLYRRRTYGEHIVFSLHLHAWTYLAFALCIALGLVLPGWVPSVITLLCLGGGALYATLAARCAYGQGLLLSLAKMTFGAGAYAVSLLVVTAITAAAAFYLG